MKIRGSSKHHHIKKEKKLKQTKTFILSMPLQLKGDLEPKLEVTSNDNSGSNPSHNSCKNSLNITKEKNKKKWNTVSSPCKLGILFGKARAIVSMLRLISCKWDRMHIFSLVFWTRSCKAKLNNVFMLKKKRKIYIKYQAVAIALRRLEQTIKESSISLPSPLRKSFVGTSN